MNTIHDILVEQINMALPRMASELISTKLASRGIKLSESKKRQLTAYISENQMSNLQFQKWKFWKRENVPIKFTEEDIRNIEEKSNTLLQKIPQIVENVLEDIIKYMTTILKESWNRQKRYEGRGRKTFEAMLAKRWEHPIDLLSMILTISQEISAAINGELRREGDIKQKNTIDVLTRLHARACQVAGEIIRLLSSGYADGAMARWRTLHEIAVVALFIQDHSEEIAERYILHSAIDSFRAANTYEKYRDKLGEPPLEQSELSKIKASYNEVMERYGNEFCNTYGWAASTIGNPNPKFTDIERNVGIDHLRPYYKMASYNIHADPKGVFFKLGLISENQMLLAGPSNFGLADPGQNTALSLCQVSSALIMLQPTMDSIISVKVMMALSEEAAESFVAIQNTIEQEEIEKR